MEFIRRSHTYTCRGAAEMMQCHYLLSNSSHPFMLSCIHGGLWYWLASCVLIARERERDEKNSLQIGHRGLYWLWCFSLILLIDCWETVIFSQTHKEMVDCLSPYTLMGNIAIVYRDVTKIIRYLLPRELIWGSEVIFRLCWNAEEPQSIGMRSRGGGGGGAGLITQPT